jgi:hypothetical protein
MPENKEIAKTGYWSSETAHEHHIHSTELADWLCLLFEKQKPVIDFGCGMGYYLQRMKENGFSKLLGYEGEPPKIKYFDGIIQQDITKAIKPIHGNVLSLEVGEHIPEEYCTNYIDNLVNHCGGYIVLSWAVPGQPGRGHVNCLSNQEVIQMIETRGFKYLPKVTQSARSIITDSTYWLRDTIMIFE